MTISWGGEKGTRSFFARLYMSLQSPPSSAVGVSHTAGRWLPSAFGLTRCDVLQSCTVHLCQPMICAKQHSRNERCCNATTNLRARRLAKGKRAPDEYACAAVDRWEAARPPELEV